ncbi:flagellar hook-associated protein FlgL [Sporomusa termitida]|uniref:Flagellar hook-associated protein 3 n=1 Tax=Sporomusa termitida TaxID=2377 RepID=A0A517DX92_9FIRM|nr:flagellar hook-associated protein FlgL [Sporomusa termitida]QDR81967.1 flagellar hook-associated protein 3 [Sporomusa termitida]
MRVSTNMLTHNFLISLNKSMQRQNEIQEQLSDGKALHRPSDDPVKTIRSLRFNINLRQNEQYTQNVKDAISWMETTDGAVSDLSSIMIKAKELVIKAVNPNPDMAMEAIAKELDGIINQAIEIGNSKVGDRYVFAGQQDKTEPFKRRMVTAADGTQFETVVYSGDTSKISMRIQPGEITPSQDSVGLTGADLFGPLNTINEGGTEIVTADLLNNLLRVKEALEGKNSNVQSNPAGGATQLAAGSPEDHAAFTFKVDNVAGGLPTQVAYSLDGGLSWKTDATVTGGQITFPKENMGTTADVVYDMTSSAYTAIGDTYTVPNQTTAGTPDLQWLSKVGIDLVDKSHDKILRAQTEIGARMSMYEQAQALLEKNNVIITSDVGANEDLDIAKAIIDFKTSESVYKAALSVGARLMPPSLVDFLS